jgi:hypothetical protein
MLNFNVKPYYDDFDETKNYHRVLFKPGFAVQARELTQAQTILQNQVTKFADHIFAQNSPVSGGQLTVNTNCYYVKLQDTYNGVSVDIQQFKGLLVKNNNGSVLARVIAIADATGGDPPTLVLSYLSGPKFADNDIVYDVNSNLAARALLTGSTGVSSTAHITQGVFYVLGNFVSNIEDTVILSKYSSVPSVRVGLNINETIHDYVDDSSLLDPAVGASNYQAPGADRYMIQLTLETRPIAFGDDQTFIELLRIENGQIVRKVDSSVYSVIDDYFAKRTYDTNGDYVVNDFSLVTKTNDDPTKYTMNIGKGIAYVHGYRIENQSTLGLASNRARDTAAQNNNPVYVDYGSYLYVNNLRGANGSVFDVSTTQAIDLHCVSVANINSTNTATYNATVVSSGYVRGLTFDNYTSQSDANSYTYKAFVNDLQNAVATANAIAGGTNTITLPGTYSTTSNAYLGVTISITAGPSAGDFRTIASYNGATRVATVNSPWTTTPNTASVFALNFALSDAESMVTSNTAHYILSSAALSTTQGRSNGTSSGDAILQNPNVPEMLFHVGMPYVSYLADSSYTATQMFRGITFTSSGSNLVAQLPFGGDYTNVMRHLGTGGTTLSADTVTQNFLVVVTNKGSSNYNVGDLLPWTINSRTVTLNSDGSIATLTGTSADLGGTFTATVIVKAFVSNADNTGHILKRKNLITANTQKVISSSNTAVNNGTYTYIDDTALTSSGQVYIQNAGLVSPGSKQSLYVSDVKKIIKIIDTKNANNTPNVAMLTDSSYDVTRNFIFDNGQRDSFYDHASVKLKVGAPKIQGNMLVLMDYYQHTGGDGYFSVMSYLNSSLPEDYREIGTYTAKSGATYQLRDSLDFRPSRQNGVYSFAFRYSNSGDTQRYGTILPLEDSTFITDYQYYLARKDKLVLSKDRSFQIVEGSSSINPIFPPEPDNSLLIANIIHDPYTGYLPSEAPAGVKPNISIEPIKHKRYTMQDIAAIDQRIGNLEYYTSLNLLEQQTQALQITDAYGLNRFKNGIVVDNFSGFVAADSASDDFLASINRRERKMGPMQLVKNFPLKSLDVTTTWGGQFSPTALASLTYSVENDGVNKIFCLPYTTANVASQKVASRSFNLNPFSVVNRKGDLSVTPNIGKPSVNILPVVQPNNPAVGPSTSGQDCTDETYWQPGSGWGAGGELYFGEWVTHTVCLPKNPVTTGDWKTSTTGTQTTTSTTTTNTPTYNWKVTGQNQSNGTDNNDGTFTSFNNYIKDNLVSSYLNGQQFGITGDNLLINAPVSGTLSDDPFAFKTANPIDVTVTPILDNPMVGQTIFNGSNNPIGQILATSPNVDGTTTLHIDIHPSNYGLNDGDTIYAGGFNLNSTSTHPDTQFWTGKIAGVKDFTTTVNSQPTPTSVTLNSPNVADAVQNLIGTATPPTLTFWNPQTGDSTTATVTNYNSGTQVATLDTSVTVTSGTLCSFSPVTSNLGIVAGVAVIQPDTYTAGPLVIKDTSSGTKALATVFSGSFINSSLQTDTSAAPGGKTSAFASVASGPTDVGTFNVDTGFTFGNLDTIA